MSLETTIALVRAKYPKARIANLSKPWRKPDDLTYEQEVDFKPRGLWYGIGESWLDWLDSEQANWYGPYTYVLDIPRGAEILSLRTADAVVAFEQKFGVALGRTTTRSIDWRRVAKDYCGVEIAPYQHSLRYGPLWYYGWDVASGCIWNPACAPRARLIADDSEAGAGRHGRYA